MLDLEDLHDLRKLATMSRLTSMADPTKCAQNMMVLDTCTPKHRSWTKVMHGSDYIPQPCVLHCTVYYVSCKTVSIKWTVMLAILAFQRAGETLTRDIRRCGETRTCNTPNDVTCDSRGPSFCKPSADTAPGWQA